MDELKQLYEAVFDDKDSVKACGRRQCMKLIHCMQKFTNEDVGDELTGVMNVGRIVQVYHSIMNPTG